jgi:hypothetical protein
MPANPLDASAAVATWDSSSSLSAGVTVKLTVKVPALIEEAVDVRFPVAAAALTLALAFAVYQATEKTSSCLTQFGLA